MEDDAFAESAAPLIQLGGLSITGTAKLNLEAGNMIISNTPLSTIQGYITTGYKKGTWNGNGLYSTTAKSSGETGLAYASASSLGVGSFGGQMVSPTDTLIRYTWYGDTNLDGTVNSSDFANLAANYNKTSQLWLNGDFNYDGTVNALDFNALATNYGKSAMGGDLPDAAMPLGALVPEPSIAMVFATLLLRRRRQ